MTNLSQAICEYISGEWIRNAKSNRAFAIEHNIDEKTVRRILDDPNYTMQLETLQKILEARSIKLSDFFAALGL